MIKENQFIEVAMSPSTKKWYESLGYNYKINEHFYINPEDLPENSHKKIDIFCDFCGEGYRMEYRYYLNNIRENNKKFKCKKCCHKDKVWNDERLSKMKKTNLKKYGFEIASKSSRVKEKTKNTCKEKYGVEYASQSDFIKEKIKNSFQNKYHVNSALQVEEFKNKSIDTYLKNYGVKNPLQSEKIKEKVFKTNIEKYGNKCCLLNNEIKEKSKQTTLEHFGVEYSLSSELVREKAKQTNLIKYGYENPAKSTTIQNKIRKSFFKNGKVRTSKQQLDVYNILIDKYNNCKLNFPLGIYNLDCALFIDDIKIDIEYDGWYWHNINDMQEKDTERDSYVNKKGFKILRIKAGRSIPKEELLFKLIEELRNTDEKYKEIILPEWEQNIIKKDC